VTLPLVDRLLKENEALKRTNAALEAALAGEGSVGVLVGEDPGVAWTASQGMTSANGESTVSVAEYRVLRAKLKRAEKSVAELSSHYEELRNKERKFMLASKQSEDTSRRLRSLHAENEELRASLQRERSLKEAAMADAAALRDETAALQMSERSLREERSRTLTELSVLRQRVREMDMERKSHYAMNR
jgi:chromosome segregation ATPase